MTNEETTKDYKKLYENALERAKVVNKGTEDYNIVSAIFPELRESEDEKIRKELLDYLDARRIVETLTDTKVKEEWIAWLKKQRDITKLSEEEEQNRFAKGVLSGCAISFINHLDAHTYEGKMCVSNGECKDIENAFHNAMWDRLHRYYCKYIEKPGKQEQLYIRFGEIPTDEKSKIYRGGIEVGAENGVSVYPAFKTDEGDIVLGLSLPITKTTLYTQQHLIEYDDRSCYLVKGDYVGKDSDGQPLINNISIIEKIDEVESKFKVGDWCIDNEDDTIFQIVKVLHNTYTYRTNAGKTYSCTHYSLEDDARLWTIQDAKDGDVLADDYSIIIFRKIGNETWNDVVDYYVGWNYKSKSGINIQSGISHYGKIDNVDFKPATKEQCDLLFQKMKEAGYEWDAEDKVLKNIEPKPDYEDYEGMVEKFKTAVENKTEEELIEQLGIEDEEQNPTWSEEDERMYKAISIALSLKDAKGYLKSWHTTPEESDNWLESLKGRIALINKNDFDRGYDVGISAAKFNQWKPTDEQMKSLKEACDEHWEPDGLDPLYTLYQNLKKLKE